MPIIEAESNYTGEVAERCAYADGSGEIGVISSVTQAFCSTCTRARLSTDGKLYTCLPQFIGELGSGEQRQRGYNYTDEVNVIVYTAAYQVGKTNFKKSDIEEAIGYYIKGQALAVNGTVSHQDIGKLGSDDGAYFTMEYDYKGFPVRKYGAVIYRDGQFYQWTVQDIPSLTVFQRSKEVVGKLSENEKGLAEKTR